MTHRSAPNEAVVANAIPITTLIFFAALEVPVSTITMGAPIRFNYRASGTTEISGHKLNHLVFVMITKQESAIEPKGALGHRRANANLWIS